MTYKLEDALCTIEQATSCSDHPGKPVAADEIESVVYFEDRADRNLESSDTLTICKLKSGFWILAQEWSDYTGHGCQCSGTLEVFDSLADLVACGLDKEQRGRIKL
jgi:hypothetical protein